MPKRDLLSVDSLLFAICTCLVLLVLAPSGIDAWHRTGIRAETGIAAGRILEWRAAHGTLPGSLDDAGTSQETQECLFYRTTGADTFQISTGGVLGESDILFEGR